MAEYLIQDTTLAGMGDEIRILYGTEETMTPAVMTENLGNANTEVDAQTDLIKRIKIELGMMALNNLSWSEISEIATSGQAQNYWAIGDTKKVILNGTVGTLSLDNYETYVYIIGFDHNAEVEGSGITFGTFKTAQTDGADICLVNSNYGSSSTDGTKYFNMQHWGYYNYGGWAGCDLRYDILGSTDTPPSGYGADAVSGRTGYDASSTCATNPVPNTLMEALPSELRAVMKPITKYTDNVGGGSDTASNVTVSVDYLPLLAEFEIFGSRSYTNSAEQNYQVQYDYYSAGNSKVKYRHSATSSTAHWWVRSPQCSYSTGFCSVHTAGGANSGMSYSSFGLTPIFRVGADTTTGGGNTPTIISFTIYNTLSGAESNHNAEEGMTWAEWCNSTYNELGLAVSSTEDIIVDSTNGTQIEYNDMTVTSTDTIITGVTYNLADAMSEPGEVV